MYIYKVKERKSMIHIKYFKFNTVAGNHLILKKNHLFN